MTMKLSEFETIISFISSHRSSLLRSVVEDVYEKFGNKFSRETLLSICLISHQRHVKEVYAAKSSSDMVEHYFMLYNRKSLKAQEPQGSILLAIAEQYALPPSILARLILRKHVLKQLAESSDSKKNGSVHIKEELAQMMKNPFLIKDQRLSYEVRQCILHDIGYGSITDSIRHMIGVEYEDTLVQQIQKVGIPFQNESDMRKLGYDKTPDIKLEIPIAVNDQVVCWIESKASFGTPKTHEQYLNEQYYSYLNRFGPGLVIYWFGFVQELGSDLKKQGILLMDSFPSSDMITRFQPENVQPSSKTIFNKGKST